MMVVASCSAAHEIPAGDAAKPIQGPLVLEEAHSIPKRCGQRGVLRPEVADSRRNIGEPRRT